MPVQTILLSVLPPVGIALAALLAGWRPWSGTAAPGARGAAASASALGLAFAVTESLVYRSWPGFPPHESHRWLPYAGLAAAIAAILLKGKEDGRFGISGIVALASFAALRWSELSSKSSVVYGALWVVLATMIAGSMRTDGSMAGRCGVRVPLCWLVASVGMSMVAVKDALSSALMSGSIAAVLGVFVVFAVWRPRWEFVPGLAPVAGVLYVGMLLTVSTFIESKVLLLLAGLAPGLASLPALAKLKPWMTTVLCLLLTAVLAVLAIWQSPGGFDFSME
jgi:hypothetical protein